MSCNDLFRGINASNIVLVGKVTCVGQSDGTFGLSGDTNIITPESSYVIYIGDQWKRNGEIRLNYSLNMNAPETRKLVLDADTQENFRSIPLLKKTTCSELFKDVDMKNIDITGGVTCIGQEDGTFGISGNMTIEIDTAYNIVLKNNVKYAEITYVF